MAIDVNPVPMGMLHKHHALLYDTDVDGSASDTDWTALDLSDHVPVGCTGIEVHVHIKSNSTSDDFEMSDADGGSDYVDLENNVVNKWSELTATCPIDTANRRVFWKVSNTRVAFQIWINFYLI